ncbi:high mobility group box 3, partial [Coemansia spiralis]
LAEAHYNLALIYSRISGVRLYKKQRSAPRLQRDPDRPKRPPTAYLLFSVDQRPKVTAEFPGLRSQDVASKIGEAWRGLDSEAREEYADIAAGLREKYFSDIGDYKRRMFRKGQHPLENDEGEDDAGADDDAIDVPASQDPDLAAANGHGHGHGKKKK